MPDQSPDRLNGRSLVAAFARCERRLNTVVVLKSAPTMAAVIAMGQSYAQISLQPSSCRRITTPPRHLSGADTPLPSTAPDKRRRRDWRRVKVPHPVESPRALARHGMPTEERVCAQSMRARTASLRMPLFL